MTQAQKQPGGSALRRGVSRIAGYMGVNAPTFVGMAPDIVATVDMEWLAGSWELEVQTVSVDGNGEFAFPVVPAGEIWRPLWFNYGKSAGTYTIQDLWIKTDPADTELIVDGTDVTTGVERVPAIPEATMMANWAMYPGSGWGVRVGSWSVIGDAVITLLVRKMLMSPEQIGYEP